MRHRRTFATLHVACYLVYFIAINCHKCSTYNYDHATMFCSYLKLQQIQRKPQASLETDSDVAIDRVE